MKLQKTILLSFLMLMPFIALADMTDQQIMTYVAEQTAKGTSQADMVQYLLSKGVSPQRLQKLKSKMSKMKKNGKEGTSTNVSRTRTSYSSIQGTSVSSSSNASNKPSNTTNGRLVGTAGKNGKFQEGSADFKAMQSVLSEISPDSSYYVFEEEPKVKVFGRDMFRNENISFEPNMNIATPSTYVLGAGDNVFIDVFGASQTTIEGIISPDGCIVVEEFGPIQLGGLTVEEANRRVRSKLGAFYADSKIQLTVGQTRTIQIHVMGEVLVPGSYTLSAFATVFHALYSAGGVSDIGSLRTVKLYRNNKIVNTVDIYDYILNGHLSGDIRLQDNDVLVVAPYEALVNIAGKVKRPMYYEMKPSETIGKALEYAGGFASDAYTKSMRLVRKSGGFMQVFNIDDSNKDSFSIADGDSLFVDSLMMRYENMVELKGAVFRPGMYQLGDDTKTVKQLIEYADGLSESAFASHAVLQRKRKDRQVEVISVNIDGILNGSTPDFELQNEDVLFIPDLKTSQEANTLTIRGEVYEPGIYQFAYNTTVEDLVLQAGGLKESASTNKVTVARRNKNGRVETFTLDLNEDLAVEGKKSFVLQPNDEVMIKRSEGYMEHSTVSIEGQVHFQGEFSLPKENTRISEIISMAGGLTEFAAQNGVYVFRQMNEEEFRMRQNRLDDDRYNNSNNLINRSSQMQGITTLPISDSLLIERTMRENCYKVAVDVRKALNKPGCTEDLVLRDGDRIVVEEQKNTVYITGTVPYRGAVPFVEGKTLKYYLRQGGVRPSHRNLKMSYVIDQNGQAHAYRRFKKIEAGSEIYLRETTSEMKTSEKVSVIVSMASAFATAAAVVISVLN